MTLHPPDGNPIICSWYATARTWTVAVRAGQIESRRLMTLVATPFTFQVARFRY